MSLAFRLAANDSPTDWTSPNASMDVVVDLTGVLLILMFSAGSTKSCHLISNAPTSPSNLFHPLGANTRILLGPSWKGSYDYCPNDIIAAYLQKAVREKEE